MFKEEFTAEQNTINQHLFENLQEKLEEEASAGLCSLGYGGWQQLWREC